MRILKDIRWNRINFGSIFPTTTTTTTHFEKKTFSLEISIQYGKKTHNQKEKMRHRRSRTSKRQKQPKPPISLKTYTPVIDVSTRISLVKNLEEKKRQLSFFSSPELFVTPNPIIRQQIADLSKLIYDYCKMLFSFTQGFIQFLFSPRITHHTMRSEKKRITTNAFASRTDCQRL